MSGRFVVLFPRLVRGLALALLASLAACYAPTYQEGIACAPDGACPDGMICATDHTCRRAAPEPDAAGDRPDAAPPDAAPVACTGDDDCATPPSACLLPGTCNADSHTCTFPALDCRDLDGECTRGVCDPAQGGCVAQPANETSSCGAGISCGPYGACAGYADVCDNTGEQSRTCTSNTCQAGACVGATAQETAACARDTSGVGCGTTVVTSCGACAYGDACAESGAMTCQCTTYSCASGSCSAVTAPCTQPCSRDTDGASCGADTATGCTACGGFTGTCDESGTRTCTCTSYACAAGACAPTATSCAQSCSRNTDGDPCGTSGTCTGGACEHCPTC